MKPTPGEWKLQADELGVYYVNPEIEVGNENIDDPSHDSCVARCDEDWSGIPEEEQKANAHLIAASPDLLEACKRALCCFKMDSDMEEDFLPEITLLKQAISKAEGRK